MRYDPEYMKTVSCGCFISPPAFFSACVYIQMVTMSEHVLVIICLYRLPFFLLTGLLVQILNISSQLNETPSPPAASRKSSSLLQSSARHLLPQGLHFGFCPDVTAAFFFHLFSEFFFSLSQLMPLLCSVPPLIPPQRTSGVQHFGWSLVTISV